MKRAFAFSSALLMLIETARARVLQDYPPTITPPPDPMAMELMRRDVNPSTITSYSAHMNLQYFQGWFTSDDEAQAIDCATSYKWSTANGFGRCCPTTGSCPMLTTCIGNSGIGQANGRTSTCGSGLACGTMTVFDNPPAVSPVYNIFCHNVWNAWTIYRDLATVSSSSSSESSSSSAASTTPTASPSTSSPPATNSGSSSSNTGAIVGGVVGGLGVLAVAGVVLFFYRRYVNKKKANAANVPSVNAYHSSYQYAPVEADGSQEYKSYELPVQKPYGAAPVSEADSHQVERAELDGSSVPGPKPNGVPGDTHEIGPSR